MPKERIVYNHSMVTPPKVTSKNSPIYAHIIKKGKGITRRGKGRKPVKGKPTKKRKSTNSSNTVYKSLNLQKKSVSKNPKRPNSVTYATLSFPKQRKTRLSNRENVDNVMKQVRKARPLSTSEAKKLVNRAMTSK